MRSEDARRGLWTIDEARGYLGVSKSTFHELRKQADFPAPVRLSPRVVRFRPDEVEAWTRRRQEAAVGPQRGGRPTKPIRV